MTAMSRILLHRPRIGTAQRDGADDSPMPAGIAKPQLTSLIDALTILLVFLLKSFSVEGQLLTPATDLELPASSSRERPAPTVNVEVSTAAISIDGQPVAALPAVAASNSLRIPALHARLVDIVRRESTREGPVEVTILCDRTVDFAVLKKVMATCAQADCSDFSLLVLQEG